MTLPNPTSESVMLDVRDRLARIEVKIDNTADRLKEHDNRLAAHDSRLDAAERAAAEVKTQLATYAKIAAALAAIGGGLMWLLEHSSTLVAVATAVPH